MKGSYHVGCYDGPNRRSLSLRTDNYELACQRYAGGLKKLLQRIRDQQAKPQEKLSWLPDEVEQIKRDFEAAAEQIGWGFDPVEMAEQAAGRRSKQDPETGDLLDPAIKRLAEQIAGIEQVTWEDLRTNAEKIRKRKTGKPYTPGWHRNLTTLLKTVDFKPQGLTAERIARWLDEQEAKGMDSVTLKNRTSALQGLIERAITSGYKRELAPNPFKQVDFGISKTKQEQRNYYCPTEEDYRKLFLEVLPEQPERIAVGLELMCWTGVRVSGLPYHSQSTEMGWLDVPDVPGTKGGGRVPVPTMLWNRGRDLKISVRALNKALKQVHPKLCNHGLRSGFKMLSRKAGIDSQLGEALLMHKLQGLESVYGGKIFPDDALEAGAKRVWAELEKVLIQGQ